MIIDAAENINTLPFESNYPSLRRLTTLQFASEVKFAKFSMLKLSKKKLYAKFDAFSRQNDPFIFPPKESGQKQKC